MSVQHADLGAWMPARHGRCQPWLFMPVMPVCRQAKEQPAELARGGLDRSDMGSREPASQRGNHAGLERLDAGLDALTRNAGTRPSRVAQGIPMEDPGPPGRGAYAGWAARCRMEEAGPRYVGAENAGAGDLAHPGLRSDVPGKGDAGVGRCRCWECRPTRTR